MKKRPKSSTRFLDTYGELSLYDIDIESRYIIYDEDVHFVKGYGYYLIGNPVNPYVTSTDNGYFSFMMNCLTEY